MVRNLPASEGDTGSIPGSGRFPWRRKRQPIPVFLPGRSRGQRTLAGYSPSWDGKRVEHNLATKKQQLTWTQKNRLSKRKKKKNKNQSILEGDVFQSIVLRLAQRSIFQTPWEIKPGMKFCDTSVIRVLLSWLLKEKGNKIWIIKIYVSVPLDPAYLYSDSSP